MIKQYMKSADTNGDGFISLHEFEDAVRKNLQKSGKLR